MAQLIVTINVDSIPVGSLSPHFKSPAITCNAPSSTTTPKTFAESITRPTLQTKPIIIRELHHFSSLSILFCRPPNHTVCIGLREVRWLPRLFRRFIWQNKRILKCSFTVTRNNSNKPCTGTWSVASLDHVVEGNQRTGHEHKIQAEWRTVRKSDSPNRKVCLCKKLSRVLLISAGRLCLKDSSCRWTMVRMSNHYAGYAHHHDRLKSQ